jgi:eukaryotic-like serine/threonine-protein kinase
VKVADPFDDTMATGDGVTRTLDAAPAEAAPAALGTVDRDHYEVLAVHGRGGLGRILRARDRRTGRTVAIKEMLRDTPGAELRFAREAVITANLQHPAIVPVYEVGQWGRGEPFYAMKLVAGETLEAAIRGAASFEARLALLPHVLSVAEALAYAHSVGVIHRDLKPANVLIGPFGETVVIDWGLAKNLADPDDHAPELPALPSDDGLTAAGVIMGTPAYMPPEQASSAAVDERADVYAIGAILYHLLAGRAPYAEADKPLAAVRAGLPAPLRDRCAGAAPDLIALVERAMARAPGDRYPDAGELALELRRFQTGKLVAAHDYTAWQLLHRWVRRHRAVVTATSLLVAALVVGGVVTVRRIVAEKRRADTALARETDANRRGHGIRADLHDQLAVRELDADEPQRALVHFAEAARTRGAIAPAARHQIGLAAAPVTPLRHAWRAHDRRTHVAIAPDGGVVVTWGSEDPIARAWSTDGRALGELAHDAAVTEVWFSEDGRRIVTAARDLSTWDATSLGLIHRARRTDADAIVAIAARPGTPEIAVADASGQIALWSVDAPAPRVAWNAHAAAIRALAFDAAGARIASASEDQTAAVWSADTGAQIATIAGHAAAVIGVAFSPDGTLVATCGGDPLALVAEARTGAIRHRLRHDAINLSAVMFSRDGRLVTTDEAGAVQIWDPLTGARLAAGHGRGRITHARLTPDGQGVVTGSTAGAVELWAIESGDRQLVLRGSPTPTSGIAMSDRGLLVTTTWDGYAMSWDVATPRAVVSLRHAARVRNAIYLGDGGRVLTYGGDGTARIWEAATGALLRTVEDPGGPILIGGVAADGRRFATGSGQAIRVWDAETGALIHTLDHGDGEVASLAFTPDGSGVVTAARDGVARMWAVETGTLRYATAAGPAPLYKVVISHDGAFVAALAEGPTSSVFAATDGAVQRQLATGHLISVDAAFSPDGAQLAIGGYVAAPGDDAVAVFDVAGAGPPRRLVGLDALLVMSVDFDADGRRLVTGSDSGTARVWDAVTGAQLAVAGSASELVLGARFAAQGELVVGVSEHGGVHAWDAATGAVVWSGQGHAGPVYRIAVHPDGRQLATAGEDAAARLWSLPRFEGGVDDLDQLVRCRAHWRLDGSALLPAAPDCDAHRSRHSN